MLSDVPYIETYRGFASESRVIFNARLLNKANHYSDEMDSFWQNLKNIYRKVVSEEIPYGKVHVNINNNTILTTADKEGYIFIDIPIKVERHSISRWEEVKITTSYTNFNCEYLIPSCKASYGIITDIDDTILITDVHHPLRMLINSIFKNPFQRASFEGIQDFYENMFKGGINPVFYLSNSPWNLYQNIKQFLEIQNLPKGPILLRDYGLHFPRVPHAYSNHKEINIELLINIYPRLPFILIGDASQEDAIIYSHIARQYPSHIKAIYIREVSSKNKMERLKRNPEVDNKRIQFFKEYTELITSIAN